VLAVAASQAAEPRRPSDARAGLEVRRLLYRDAGLIEVEVRVVMGILYLRGTVADIPARDRAEALAGGAPGVEQVRNRIRLRDPSRGRRPDAEIDADVRRALAGLGAPPALRVAVRDGGVSLSGSVGDPQAWAVLEACVEAVRRVSDVQTIDLGGLEL
jgi:osmotically-inducible protein OsmY